MMEDQTMKMHKEDVKKKRYIELASKQVPDRDGYMTDFTMYHDTFADKYMFILGDKDSPVCSPEEMQDVLDRSMTGFLDMSEYDEEEWGAHDRLLGHVWERETEKKAWDHYRDYKGETFSELPRISFSKEIQDRVTKAAATMSELSYVFKYYSRLDKSEYTDTAKAEQYILSCSTNGALYALYTYNEDWYDTFMRNSEKVAELEDAAIDAAGWLNGYLIREYVNGHMEEDVLREKLSPTAVQLAILYREEKNAFENSTPYKARDLTGELQALQRNILVESFKSMESDVFFSDEDYLAIYELKDTEENRGYKFRRYKEFTENGKEVSLDDYEPVYIGKGSIAYRDLRKLYKDFDREDFPKNYAGYDLHTSNVIVQHTRRGDINVNFVDSEFGDFRPVESFFNEYALESNNMEHLIHREEDGYVCQSFNKQDYSPVCSEKLHFHQIQAHIKSIDPSGEETCLKRTDARQLKENIKQEDMKKQQALENTQPVRKPRL